MASYRYERNIKEEDLRPLKERHYTRKERWNNWWDYNLKWVVLAVIVVGFVGYCFIGQYFFTVHPDYNIGGVAPYYLPEDTVNALQTQLAAFGEDLNGDGENGGASQRLPPGLQRGRPVGHRRLYDHGRPPPPGRRRPGGHERHLYPVRPRRL